MINELADRIIMKVRKLSYPVYKILNQIAFLHCHVLRHLLTRQIKVHISLKSPLIPSTPLHSLQISLELFMPPPPPLPSGRSFKSDQELAFGKNGYSKQLAPRLPFLAPLAGNLRQLNPTTVIYYKWTHYTSLAKTWRTVIELLYYTIPGSKQTTDDMVKSQGHCPPAIRVRGINCPLPALSPSPHCPLPHTVSLPRTPSPGTLKIRLAGITGVYEPPDKPSSKSLFKRKISASHDTKKHSLDSRNSISASGLVNLILTDSTGCHEPPCHLQSCY